MGISVLYSRSSLTNHSVYLSVQNQAFVSTIFGSKTGGLAEKSVFKAIKP